MPVLWNYAGTSGALAVIKRSGGGAWKVVGEPSNTDPDVDIDIEAGAKRSRPSSGDNIPAPKRVRLDEDTVQNGTSSCALPCMAPNSSQETQSLLQRVAEGDYELFSGDLFLTNDFREKWCKCPSVCLASNDLYRTRTARLSQCSESLNAHPYLVTEEETYEPPADPDSGEALSSSVFTL